MCNVKMTDVCNLSISISLSLALKVQIGNRKTQIQFAESAKRTDDRLYGKGKKLPILYTITRILNWHLTLILNKEYFIQEAEPLYTTFITFLVFLHFLIYHDHNNYRLFGFHLD